MRFEALAPPAVSTVTDCAMPPRIGSLTSYPSTSSMLQGFPCLPKYRHRPQILTSAIFSGYHDYNTPGRLRLGVGDT